MVFSSTFAEEVCPQRLAQSVRTSHKKSLLLAFYWLRQCYYNYTPKSKFYLLK